MTNDEKGVSNKNRIPNAQKMLCDIAAKTPIFHACPEPHLLPLRRVMLLIKSDVSLRHGGNAGGEQTLM